MASPLSVAKLSANLAITSYSVTAATGGVFAAGSGTYVDFSGYNRLIIIASNQVLTGTGVVANGLQLYVASDAAGTGSTLVRTCPCAAAAGTVGLQFAVEAIAQEIDNVLANGRYINAKITTNNASDVIAVSFILALPRFPQSQLTPTT